MDSLYMHGVVSIEAGPVHQVDKKCRSFGFSQTIIIRQEDSSGLEFVLFSDEKGQLKFKKAE